MVFRACNDPGHVKRSIAQGHLLTPLAFVSSVTLLKVLVIIDTPSGISDIFDGCSVFIARL